GRLVGVAVADGVHGDDPAAVGEARDHVTILVRGARRLMQEQDRAPGSRSPVVNLALRRVEESAPHHGAPILRWTVAASQRRGMGCRRPRRRSIPGYLPKSRLPGGQSPSYPEPSRFLRERRWVPPARGRFLRAYHRL